MTNTLILYLAVYIAVLFLLTALVARNQDDEDYLIAGRNRSAWQIMLSKFAAAIGAGYFITYTGFAYEYGIGIFAFLIGMIGGYLIFAFWAAPRIALNSKEEKFYTLGHFVESKLQNKTARMLSDFIASAILFSWLLVGLVGSGKIISDFELLSYNSAVLVTSAVVLIYLLIAGYWAVILTDLVQSIIIFVLMAVVTFAILGKTGFVEIHRGLWGKLNYVETLSFLLFGVLSVFCYSDRYQLSYAAKNNAAVKWGLSMAVLPVLIVAYLLMLIGLFMAAQMPGLDSGLVFTAALKYFLHPSLVPIAVVLFFAGIMSSADTNIYAIASSCALSRGAKGNYKKNLRLNMIALSVLVAVLAIAFPDVVKVSIIAGLLSLLLSVAMIYLIAGGRSWCRFRSAIILAIIGMFLGIWFWGIVMQVALPIILFGLLGLRFGAKKTQKC